MKVTIDINRTFLQELGADAFFVLTYCLAYYTKKEEIPTKKSICSDLRISGKKANDSLDLLLSKLEKVGTNTVFKEYKFLLNSNLYSCYKNRKAKPDKKNIPSLEEKIWIYIVREAAGHYSDQQMRGFYWWIGMKVRELIKKITKERIKEYTAWWMKNKAERIEKFGPGIFFYDGIIDEFKGRKAVKPKVPPISERKGEFEKQAEAEAKEMYAYLVDREDSNKLSDDELDLLDAMRKEK